MSSVCESYHVYPTVVRLYLALGPLGLPDAFLIKYLEHSYSCLIIWHVIPFLFNIIVSDRFFYFKRQCSGTFGFISETFNQMIIIFRAYF